MRFIKYLFFFIFLLNLFNFLSASEIEILEDIPGNGPEIINHSKVAVHYIGTLEDGTEFDSSFKRNEPFLFQIGVRQVIPGWELGLIGMKVGGKRTIKIPPNLAYGDSGAGGVIPPNSTLIFNIDVLKVEPPLYKIINPYELKSMDQDDINIIDIRLKKEWKKTGVIKNSNKITAFDEKGNFLESFLKKFNKFADLDIKIIFVSSEGDISSILANGFVEQLGYRNIFSLEGGIKEWKKYGYELK